MQKVGTDLIRDQLKKVLPEALAECPTDQLWIEHLRLTVEEHRGRGGRIAVTDVRFLDEARAILDMGGVLLFVERDPGQLAAYYREMGWEQTGVEVICRSFESDPRMRKVTNAGSLGELQAAVLSELTSFPDA